MEFTKEQIIQAAGYCRTDGSCAECLFKDKNCDAIFRDYIISTENEPASVPAPTSSENKKYISNTDDTPESKICQVSAEKLLTEIITITEPKKYVSCNANNAVQSLTINLAVANALLNVLAGKYNEEDKSND